MLNCFLQIVSTVATVETVDLQLFPATLDFLQFHVQSHLQFQFQFRFELHLTYVVDLLSQKSATDRSEVLTYL